MFWIIQQQCILWKKKTNFSLALSYLFSPNYAINLNIQRSPKFTERSRIPEFPSQMYYLSSHFNVLFNYKLFFLLNPILCCFFLRLFFGEKKEADRHVAPTINRAHLLASSVLTISPSLSPSRNIIFAHNSLALHNKEKKTNFPSRYRWVARATRSDLEEITSWTITLKLKPRYYTLISSLFLCKCSSLCWFLLKHKITRRRLHEVSAFKDIIIMSPKRDFARKEKHEKGKSFLSLLRMNLIAQWIHALAQKKLISFSSRDSKQPPLNEWIEGEGKK